MASQPVSGRGPVCSSPPRTVTRSVRQTMPEPPPLAAAATACRRGRRRAPAPAASRPRTSGRRWPRWHRPRYGGRRPEARGSPRRAYGAAETTGSADRLTRSRTAPRPRPRVPDRCTRRTERRKPPTPAVPESRRNPLAPSPPNWPLRPWFPHPGELARTAAAARVVDAFAERHGLALPRFALTQGRLHSLESTSWMRPPGPGETSATIGFG